MLAASALVLAPGAAEAQISIGIGVNIAPPPLPVYVQPPIPAPGYLWTPGFWGWGANGYYWVPGTWAAPPAVGLLWTPGYWGWGNGAYFFHTGYWGPHVGFYGGVAYGFGYTGFGYQGGYWNNNHFFYNNAVNNVGGLRGGNFYHQPVNMGSSPRASFNGPGGATAQPTAAQTAWSHEQHFGATGLQQQHAGLAAQNPQLLASANHGNPPIAATSQPGMFHGPGVVPAGAGPGWQASHPAFNEVSQRRSNLSSDIHNAQRNGNLTSLQAQRLQGQVNQVRTQERVYANHGNGHINYYQQARMNQEENHIHSEVQHGRVTPKPPPPRHP
jgi:hypothetical protein